MNRSTTSWFVHSDRLSDLDRSLLVDHRVRGAYTVPMPPCAIRAVISYSPTRSITRRSSVEACRRRIGAAEWAVSSDRSRRATYEAYNGSPHRNMGLRVHTILTLLAAILGRRPGVCPSDFASGRRKAAVGSRRGKGGAGHDLRAGIQGDRGSTAPRRGERRKLLFDREGEPWRLPSHVPFTGDSLSAGRVSSRSGARPDPMRRSISCESRSPDGPSCRSRARAVRRSGWSRAGDVWTGDRGRKGQGRADDRGSPGVIEVVATSSKGRELSQGTVAVDVPPYNRLTLAVTPYLVRPTVRLRSPCTRSTTSPKILRRSIGSSSRSKRARLAFGPD